MTVTSSTQPRRLRHSKRRLAACAVAAIGLSVALAGCGSEQSSILDEYDGAQGFDAVSISGDQGKEPKVDWKSSIDADKISTKTLVEGDGAKIEQGDNVYVDLWIGNGFSQRAGFSSFGDSPQQMTAGDDLGEVFGPIVNGQSVGSRVAVIVDAEDALASQLGPEYGIGDGDSALVIGDVVGTLLNEPDGKPVKPAGWAPKVVEKGKADARTPSALNFAGTPKPTKDLQKTTLIQGTGAPIKEGQSVTVNYLGQVYGGKEPFDSSYTNGQPYTFPYSSEPGAQGGPVKGWIEGLKGVKVGSRIILAVPPTLGYGDQGNPQGGIKPTDTMYFVVDVLGTV